MNEIGRDWIEALGALRTQREPCVMVVVTQVRGSAPREASARMLVDSKGELLYGTIGGGNLELQALQHARDLLQRPAAPSESIDFPLAEKTGQCCGGAVTLFFEPFRWQRNTLAIFGAGHVGQALGALAPWIGAELLLIDGRQEEEIQPALPKSPPYRLVCVDEPEAEIDTLPRGCAIVVMTHSHALDQRILERVLRFDHFAYIGLIGSDRKWIRFQKRLNQKGFSEEAIQRITCPIGLTQGSKEPTAIALSTATQIVEVFSGSASSTDGRGMP